MSQTTDLRSRLDVRDVGESMYELVSELYPICRSITGDGFRETQDGIRRHVPELELKAVPSGTQAYDWIVPKEWNIRDAYVIAPNGEKVIDFKRSNLHVVSYSVPVRSKMTLDQLKGHLHTLPEYPQWIPYRASYYNETWGFCMAHNDYEKLADGEYEVVIDSTLEDGVMNWGECLLRGETDDEVLITAHACHPSLCNDNLSGLSLATFLAKHLRGIRTRYSYRFLFIPGGIGSVVWLSQNEDKIDRIKHGLVAACVGDPGVLTYKKTRRGNAEIDQAAQNVLRYSGRDHRIIEFSPYGYDERNFCSAKYDLPVGSLSRSTHSEYSGYHSSGDDLNLVRPEYLSETFFSYLELIDALENNRRYQNTIPEAEPQLGKRGLYGLMGGLQKREDLEVACLWVMNCADGEHTLLDISDRSGFSFDVIRQAADLLQEQDLLVDADNPTEPTAQVTPAGQLTGG